MLEFDYALLEKIARDRNESEIVRAAAIKAMSELLISGNARPQPGTVRYGELKNSGLCDPKCKEENKFFIYGFESNKVPNKAPIFED